MHSEEPEFSEKDIPDLSGYVAIVTRVETGLDILINNAGVMTVPYKLTSDGLETQWQVNYVAPHVFTSSLMPLLLSTALTLDTKNRVQVVNVSSDAAFYSPDTVQWNDVNMTSTKGGAHSVKRQRKLARHPKRWR
ncbi:hypothetical protein THARTR1_04264 [Trichoderma harzianum]|uniref:Short-chain dehydrogenase n=1 Tax=Trichoderma harzianum TaxID=5544 RepID=A0A2K0UCC9_TRIHA|nr:hypothetical protein THARTR1_04264 [Trichoderma harzianum]